MAYHLQNVLNGGELSPLLSARGDQPRYQTGERELLNFVVMPQGGVTRRPGMVYLGTTRGETSRLIPFVFSATQGRMLELGDKSLRVWLPDGRLVARDGAPLVVDAPFAAADLRELTYAQSADVVYFAHPGYPPCKVSRYADDDWRFETLSFEPVIAAPGALSLAVQGDSTATGTATYTYVVTAIDADTGQESKPSEPAAISAKALSSTYSIRVRWEAVPDASEYRVYRLKGGVYGFVGRTSADNSELEVTSVDHVTVNGARFANTGQYVLTPDVYNAAGPTEGADWGVRFGVSVGTSAYNTFYSATLGKLLIYLDTDVRDGSPLPMQVLVARGWLMLSNVGPAIAGTYDAYAAYGAGLGYNGLYPSGIAGGLVVEPSLTYDRSYSYFDDTNIAADGEDTPPQYKNPFDAKGKYPAHVFFHQQRLGYAASQERPITIWLSRTGDFENLSSAVPPHDDDAIEVSLASAQANRIVWLLPDRGYLAFGTEGSEWTLSPSEGTVLTPLNPSFEMQTSNGGAAVRALSVDGAILYVQRGSGAIREFSYVYTADKYTGQDLTILARHILADRGVVAWAYQQEPHAVIWCALSDGTLAGLTYMRDQQVIGWHRHETDGEILDVATMPGVPGDQVWFLVRRGASVFVERFAPFFDDVTPDSGVFLDASLSYAGPPAASFTGLEHLEGRTVTAFADGGTVDNLTVTGGGVTLPRPASSAHIGLSYVSRLVPNLPEIQTQYGSSMLHNRRVLGVRARVYRSMSFLVGIEGGRLSPITDRHIAGGLTGTRPFFSDGTDLVLELAGAWSDDDPLVLEVSTPTPLTVLALLSTIDVSPYPGKL